MGWTTKYGWLVSPEKTNSFSLCVWEGSLLGLAETPFSGLPDLFMMGEGKSWRKNTYDIYIYIYSHAYIYIYRVCIYIIYIIVNRVLVPRPQDPLGPAGWVSLLSFLGFIKLKPSSACPAQPWEPSEPAKSWGLEDYHDYFSRKIIGFHDG